MGVAFPPAVKRYFVPFVLFSLGLFFQLVVLPSSFPPSPYDVLGVERYASAQQVADAYEKLSSKWSSGLGSPTTVEFIKVRYAFELLTNPSWKRDYDLFGIDEHLHVLEKLKKQYDGESFSKINLPLLNASLPVVNVLNVITPEEFISSIEKSKASLIQLGVFVVPNSSIAGRESVVYWKGLLTLVWWNSVMFKSLTTLQKGSPPSSHFFAMVYQLLWHSHDCKSKDCFSRYQGELSVEAVVDWMATDILSLPHVFYYSKESLVPNFIARSGQHKVKLICFSNIGERASPFLRHTAQKYWAYASFALVLWKEEDASIWWNMFGVESAPALVFLKDPAVKPVVYHGSLNSSQFLDIMEENKHQELPQLRSVTSMELGCDARGYSRAGNDTTTWYCAIIAGRPSLNLNKMRETMRRVRSVLTAGVDPECANTIDFSVPGPAVAAFKENRLTFVWLDGEVQRKYCLSYLHSENVYDTCGPRQYGDPTDVPRLFIVRYKRNSTKETVKAAKRRGTFWDYFRQVVDERKQFIRDILQEDTDHASQLVAVYKGPEDVQEITQWISQIIENGDSIELPHFTGLTSELVPEDSNPIWSRTGRNMFSARKGIRERFQGIASHVSDYVKDPRLGPCFLLGACISFGTVWLRGSQRTQPTKKDEGTNSRRDGKASSSSNDKPSSITDVEPKDAYQMVLTDSDSE